MKNRTPRRGLHVPVQKEEHVQQLIAQIPAFSAAGINLLIVEINYSYAYRSHPELRQENAIGGERVAELVRACREQHIRLVPQFQCLGHQSWAERTFALLTRYPEFDETPGQYPNNANIYCRSWCPQQPALLPILFDLFDELLDVFQADGLHVGMDEVFLIGSAHCPRCAGADPGDLFAQATNDYYAHLVGKRGVEMMMRGDRLLDDRVLGYGKWEASQNGTHTAIDRIPKDIVICDWHYELRSDYPSIPLLLDKGFGVLPAGWRDPEAIRSLIDYAWQFSGDAVLGYLATIWDAVPINEVAGWPLLRAALAQLVPDSRS